MRKQYHFWPSTAVPGALDAWDVDRLIELTARLPVEAVPIDEIPEVDSVYWFGPDDPPTVRRIAEHLRLVGQVDLGYPVILGPANRVMDGMHRIVRALLEGRTAIAAVRLSDLPEPDHRACRADELPYDR